MRQQASYRQNRSQARRGPRAARPAFESLEGRRLLAADYSVAPVTYQDIDLAALGGGGIGLGLEGQDDRYGVIDLGDRTFNLYGTTLTGRLHVSTNGVILFGTAGGDLYENDALSDSAVPQAAIAPLWDDWTLREPTAQVYYRFDDAAGRLIVQWNEATAVNGASEGVTFQAILKLNTGSNPGDIVFNYKDVFAGNAVSDGGAGATVGIKAMSPAGSDRLVVSMNGTSPDGQSRLIGSESAIRLFVNAAPVAVADGVSGDEDSVIAGNVLANDTDSNGDGLSARLGQGPAHGTLALRGDGSFTYTPAANFFGTDTFTYVASDGTADSEPATVTITVAPVNDAPVVAADALSVSAAEGGVAANSGTFGDVDAGDLPLLLTASRGEVVAHPGGTWSWSMSPADDESAAGPVFITATDAGGATSTVSFDLAVSNVAPAVDAGEGGVVPAGTSFSGAGSFSDPGADDWTATVDYGDGTGVHPLPLNGTRFELAHVYAAAGTYEVTVRVTDDEGGVGTAALTVTVTPSAPRVTSLGGPATGVRGQPRAFAATFEPGAGGETGAWAVRDAYGCVVAAGAGPSFEFTPTAAGAYSVHFTVTDANGNADGACVPLTVKAVELQAADSAGSRTSLVVGGTDADNQIQVKPAGGSALDVFIDGAYYGRFSPTAHVLVYGLGGADQIQVSDDLARAAFIWGGDGADQIQGSGGDDVIVGGAGHDQLQGKGGRDVIIGGRGADQTQGNDGEDIIIGGYTSFDADFFSLEGIWAEWSRTDRTQDQRIRALTGEIPGRNGATFLLLHGTNRTVFDDGAGDSPQGSSSDWVLPS